MKIEFLKFEKTEFDLAGAHRMVSAKIELPAEAFREVEEKLKEIGITFRSPQR